jgi:hypothetical protein
MGEMPHSNTSVARKEGFKPGIIKPSEINFGTGSRSDREFSAIYLILFYQWSCR